MRRRDNQLVAIPRGLRRLRLDAASHHDRVLRLGSVERVDEIQRRLHITASEEHVLYRQPARILCDGDVRTPAASHIAAASTTSTAVYGAFSRVGLGAAASGGRRLLARSPAGEVGSRLSHSARGEKYYGRDAQHIRHSSHNEVSIPDNSHELP